MKEELEERIKQLLKTGRNMSLPDEARLSHDYFARDEEISREFSPEYSGDSRKLGDELAERYGCREKSVFLGAVGTTKCDHTIADPDFRDSTLKFRIKYGKPAEIWKNALYSRWLSSQGDLGWCLSRDWPGNALTQFYIVMLQGKEPLLQRLVTDAENPIDNIEATIAFMGDYFFGNTKEHIKEDKNREFIKSHLDLILCGMKRTVPFPDMNQENWNKKINEVRTAICRNIDLLDVKLYYCRIVSDCIAQNIVVTNGTNGELSTKLAWIDQGYRKELLDEWLAGQQPTQEKYFKAFYGTPHFNLGHFYFALQYAENIPEVCKERFRTAIIDFVYNGRFGRRLGQAEDSDDRVKFTNWGTNTQKIAANFFALGELRAAIYNYHIGQRPDEMRRLAEIIINDIIPAGNIYTFAPAGPIKNYTN